MDWQMLAMMLLAVVGITLQYNLSVSGMGLNIAQSLNFTADGGTPREIVVPVGKAGTLTTRTDANTGTATLGSGHGIATSDLVDIYWDIAGVKGVQYKVTVGTVSGTSVPFDGGIGDDLPSAASAIVMAKRVQVNADIDGDEIELLAIKQHYDQVNETARSHVDFQDASNDEIAELDLAANVPLTYNVAAGDANPFTGDPITKFFVSNASVTNPAKLQLLALYDSTP